MDVDVDIDDLSNKFQDMYTHDPYRSIFSFFILTIAESILLQIILIVFFILNLIFFIWEKYIQLQEAFAIIYAVLKTFILIKFLIPFPNLISPEKASNDIRQCTTLSLSSVDLYVNLVNNSQAKFELRYPSYFNNYSWAYSLCAVTKRDDIQIIPVFLNESEKQIGHLICCYYNATTKVVNVYDSLIYIYSETDKTSYRRRLEHEIFNHLYPVHSYITLKKPKSLQPDLYSCAIYSMSYVNLLLQGFDPEQYELNLTQPPTDPTMGIRTRIIKMLEQNKLLSFSNQYLF